MANFLENNYNLINRVLAVTIIGSLAVAGLVLNTMTDPVSLNSRPSRPNVSFGSDR